MNWSLIELLLICILRFRSAWTQESEFEYDRVQSKPRVRAENCTCVPYYQCYNRDVVVTDGTFIIDLRQGQQELPYNQKLTAPDCGAFHVCCKNPTIIPAKHYIHRCGIRNPNGINSRILHANKTGEAEFGEYPWMAGIMVKQKDTKDTFEMLCGGALIDEQHVVTASHCTLNRKLDAILKVRLGEWNTNNDSEFLPHEDINVTKITRHPLFNSTGHQNDIAILKLEKPVDYKPHIDTVCLPKDEDNFTGKECIVTGWGFDVHSDVNSTATLKEISNPIISRARCQSIMNNFMYPKYFRLDGGNICTEDSGRSACVGDSGGPVVCYNSDNTYTLVGLVSFGIRCGVEGMAGFHVNVQRYIDWIASVTGKRVPEYWSTPF